jgi:hypothetical protein
MHDDMFGVLSFLIIFCAVIFFAGYGVAVKGTTRLETNNWECTATSIEGGKAVCIEYKTKETT